MLNFYTEKLPVYNPVNGKSYFVVPVSKVEHSLRQIERVASICNEPLIFKTLFADVFPSGKYPLSSADDWINWGTSGWEQQDYFVFVTIDPSGLIVAASDIKSANTQLAEIGYWASAHHRGIMSNSIATMLRLAREAGFKRFFAQVHKNNTRSQSVLVRNKFSPTEKTASQPQHIVYQT